MPGVRYQGMKHKKSKKITKKSDEKTPKVSARTDNELLKQIHKNIGKLLFIEELRLKEAGQEIIYPKEVQ